MTPMKTIRLATLAALAAGAAALAPAAAEACGGCFAPPGAIQVVTDHRMALSLSADRTILWDQFRYSGRPSDFSWILPIHDGPSVRIEVANNQFLTALDNLSAPVLNAPQRPYCGMADSFGFGSASRTTSAPTAAGAADAGVAVLQEQVVGPYMTVVLRSTDPMALRTWLADNGYSVPPATGPVIDFYVAQHMDFVALKLRMGEGVSSMTPIRITTPGLNPTLPLRMISAGVADKVGLVLFVLAASRWEAMNFPNGAITSSMLSYDFNAPTVPAQDFQHAFDRLNTQNGGRLWLTESSDPVANYTVQAATQGGRGAPLGGGTVTTDDVQVAFQGIGQNATLTRLRADLGSSFLDRDLQLQSSDLGILDRNYTYGHVAHMPTCDGAGSGTVARATFAGCSTAPGGGSSTGGMIVAGLAGLAVVLRRKRAR